RLSGRGRQRAGGGRRVRGRTRPRPPAWAGAGRGSAAGDGRRRPRRGAARLLGGDADPAAARAGARVTPEFLWRHGAWDQVTPEAAGWRYLHFGVRQGSFASETGEGEIAIVPLRGTCRVEAEGERWELGGR